MQKKLIAVAIAAISAAPAFAQSNVTIYGRMDYGYMSRSGDDGGRNTAQAQYKQYNAATPVFAADAGTKNEFASGIGAGSRIGFKGSEDLGNGLKAIFQAEFGIGIDAGASGGTDGATWWNRNSWVGLTGNFGTVVGGRLDGIRYNIWNKYDAFGGGTVGNFTSMAAHVDRADNAVAYISPTFGGGFTFTGAYSSNIGVSHPFQGTNWADLSGLTSTNANEANGNDGDGQLVAAMLNYANGPIELTADWEKVSFKSGAAATSTPGVFDDITVWTVGGSYDFGMVKVRALYDNATIDGRSGAGELADVDSWFLSASMPFGGKFVGKITYGETEDNKVNNSTSKKWGVGVNYNLSKRTSFMVDYGQISNDRNAINGITPAANGYLNDYGVKGFDMAIAHTF